MTALVHISVDVYCMCVCMCVFVCSYVEKYDLQEPSDDIQHVLKRIAVRLGKTQRVKAITGVGKKVLFLQITCYVQYTGLYVSQSH